MKRGIWLPDIAEQIDPLHSQAARNIAHQECWRKQRWWVEDDAKREARKVNRINQKKGDASVPVHHYQCRYENIGRHYHLGHESRRYAEQGEQE